MEKKFDKEFIRVVVPNLEIKKNKVGGEGRATAKHRGSMRAFHPAALGLILSIP